MGKKNKKRGQSSQKPVATTAAAAAAAVVPAADVAHTSAPPVIPEISTDAPTSELETAFPSAEASAPKDEGLAPPVDPRAMTAMRGSDSSTPLNLKEAINMNPETAGAKKSTDSNRKSDSYAAKENEAGSKSLSGKADENVPPAPLLDRQTEFTPTEPLELPKPTALHSDNQDIKPPEPSHQGGSRKNKEGVFEDESSKRPGTSAGQSSKRSIRGSGAAAHIKEQAKGMLSEVGRRASHRGDGEREKGDNFFKNSWKSFTALFKSS